MARPLFIEFAGVLYHIKTRGDRREPIYEDDEDRYLFLQTLAEVVKRSVCQMNNNDHLVFGMPEGSL